MPWFNYDDDPRSQPQYNQYGQSNAIPNRRKIDKFKLQVSSRRMALVLSYAPDWWIVWLLLVVEWYSEDVLKDTYITCWRAVLHTWTYLWLASQSWSWKILKRTGFKREFSLTDTSCVSLHLSSQTNSICYSESNIRSSLTLIPLHPSLHPGSYAVHERISVSAWYSCSDVWA